MNTCATTIRSDTCNVAGTRNSNVHFLFPGYRNLTLVPGVLLISLSILPAFFFFPIKLVLFFNLIRKTYYLFLNFWLSWVFCCTWAFSSCGKWGCSLSLRCSGFSWQRLPLQSRGSGVCGLSSFSPRAQLSCGIWDLTGHGIEPMSPALVDS